MRHVQKFVDEVSLPSKKFYKDLKNFVPHFEKGSIFYFDVQNDVFYQRQFSEFFSVGGMPETTAMAVYYGVDRYDFYRITDYDEFLYRISKDKIDLEKIYTFYYNHNGLSDTTAETRKYFLEGSTYKVIDDFKKINLNSSVPILANSKMNITLVDKPKTLAPAPYLKGKNYSTNQKIEIFNYLRARKRYYETVRISSETEWKYREVRNVIDNDINTVWQGHRIWWHDNHHEELTIDLGERRNIGAVFWQNWKSTLVPISYYYQVSIDGINWQKVYEVKHGSQRKDGEGVLESFSPVNARFVRMVITETLSNDSPAISEFEVINSEYGGLDVVFAITLEKNPFSIVETDVEWDVLKYYIKEHAKLRINWSTDKEVNNTTMLPIMVGSQAQYEFIIPGSGTTLLSISFDPNIPLDVTCDRLMMRNLSFDEIEKRGLVKEFAEN